MPSDRLALRTFSNTKEKVEFRPLSGFPTKKGKYSDKNEMEEVARAMCEDVSNTPYGYVYKPLWDSLWNARVPSRVKICAWKACMDILPTRAYLRRRGMALEDQDCLFCTYPSESALHVLKDCSYAAAVWFCSDLTLRASEMQSNTIKDWLLPLSGTLPASQFAMLMMVLWSIWKERQSLLLGKAVKSSPPDVVARRATTWLKEFLTLPQNMSLKPQRPNQKWSMPDAGCVKVNVDGAYDLACASGGVGVVLRDWNGDFHGALCKKIGGLFCRVDAEVVALREGVRLALDRGYRTVWFESDALNTIIARYSIERQDEDSDTYISESTDSDDAENGNSDTVDAMPDVRTTVSQNARVVLDNLSGPTGSLLLCTDPGDPPSASDTDRTLYDNLFNSVDHVIEDTREMLRGFGGEAGLSNIHPRANSVANRLAMHALCMEQQDYCCWYPEPPNFILDAMLEDCNISPTLR